jgi:hypothetical protein
MALNSSLILPVYGPIKNKLENLNIFKSDAVVEDVVPDTSTDLGAFETAVFKPNDAALALLLEP